MIKLRHILHGPFAEPYVRYPLDVFGLGVVRQYFEIESRQEGKCDAFRKVGQDE